ncbi:hypothetical protein ACTFIZ_000554, partial [Dictyostelium cf. discoideum]
MEEESILDSYVLEIYNDIYGKRKIGHDETFQIQKKKKINWIPINQWLHNEFEYVDIDKAEMITKHRFKELFDNRKFGVEYVSFLGYLPEFLKSNYGIDYSRQIANSGFLQFKSKEIINSNYNIEETNSIELSNKVLPLLSDIKFDDKNIINKGSQGLNVFFKSKDPSFALTHKESIIIIANTLTSSTTNKRGERPGVNYCQGFPKNDKEEVISYILFEYGVYAFDDDGYIGSYHSDVKRFFNCNGFGTFKQGTKYCEGCSQSCGKYSRKVTKIKSKNNILKDSDSAQDIEKIVKLVKENFSESDLVKRIKILESTDLFKDTFFYNYLCDSTKTLISRRPCWSDKVLQFSVDYKNTVGKAGIGMLRGRYTNDENGILYGGFPFPSLTTIKENSPEIRIYEDFQVMVERFTALLISMDKSQKDSNKILSKHFFICADEIHISAGLMQK